VFLQRQGNILNWEQGTSSNDLREVEKWSKRRTHAVAYDGGPRRKRLRAESSSSDSDSDQETDPRNEPSSPEELKSTTQRDFSPEVVNSKGEIVEATAEVMSASTILQDVPSQEVTPSLSFSVLPSRNLFEHLAIECRRLTSTSQQMAVHS